MSFLTSLHVRSACSGLVLLVWFFSPGLRAEDGGVVCFSARPDEVRQPERLILTAVHQSHAVDDEHAVEIAEVSRVVRQHMPEGSAGGIGVLVTRQGKVLHRKGYGFVKGRPMTSQSPLSLASVTKQYAAMCAVMLIEERRLDQKQKVSHYLPDLNLPAQCRELLVQDLLWHISGLGNFIEAEEKTAIAKFKQQRGLGSLTNKTHAEWLATMDVRRPPGLKFEYTNSGYVLLARIVEVVTGEAFHDFQKRRIFDVLQLEGTTDSRRLNGSGNIRTTLFDYTRWDQALWEHDARLLSAAGYKTLFADGVLDNGEPVGYGFGWRVHYQGKQLVTAEHGGVGSGTTAARNLVRRYFNDQTTVAIFAQENKTLGRSDRAAIVSDIYDWLLKNE